ncbi:MAG TPA: extracellular solute-binding protein [Devosia sp.]|nr:extracellular solute-binding protein [Devosia sp.]
MKSKHKGTGGPNRRHFLLGAAASGVALAAAAGSVGRAFAQDQQLVFWSQLAGSKKAAGEALEAAFTAAHPEIKLTSSLFAEPSQLNEKILTAINGNTAPDLFIQHWDYTLTYSTGDKLADLKTGLANVNFDDLDAGLLAYGSIGGEQVSMPLYGTSRGLGINRKFVVEAGLDPDKGPQNWAELREWAKALTKRAESGLLEVAGFSMFHNDLETWEIFTLLLQGAGGTLFNADLSAPAFAGPEGLKALNFMFELLNTDHVTDLGFGLGPGGSASPLNQSRAAMIIAGNYSTNNALKAGLEFDVLPIPMENGGFTSLVDPFSFAVTKGSPNQAAAMQFIEFALTEEQQVAFALASKNVPVLKSAQQDATVQADPYLAKFIKTASYAPPNAAAIPAFSRMVTIIARAVQETLFKRVTAEEALKAAEAEVIAVLSR